MKIKKIYLDAKSPEKLFPFYGELLGLRAELNDSGSCLVYLRDSTLIFRKTSATMDPFYHFAFNISSNKLMRAFEWLKKRVAPLWIEEDRGYIADFVNWNARSFYFFDPAGNIVEFIARFDLPDKAAQPFSTADIYSISEMGLVFESARFDEEVNSLMAETGLNYFSKQPPLPGFRAVGDDEGLLICVPESRAWYPGTESRSGIFTQEIVIDTGEKEYVLQY
jgi:hypothetical protein